MDPAATRRMTDDAELCYMPATEALAAFRAGIAYETEVGGWYRSASTRPGV